VYTTLDAASDFDGFVCFSYYISIAGFAPANSPGTWTIRVTWNQNASVLASRQFTLYVPAAPSISGLVDGVSFQSNRALAPGSFISLFGSNLAGSLQVASSFPLATTLGNVKVVVGGKAAPLLFVSTGQINAILPYSLSLNTQQQVVVQNGGSVSASFTINIGAGSPSVFSTNGTGQGQGHIYVAQANGALRLADSSSAARAGDTLVIYCGGLGAVSPAVADGSMAPLSSLVNTVNPVTVSIGGKSAQVFFAGLAPGFAAGLYQVNVVMPAGVTAGNAVSLQVSVAGQVSGTVTMAAR
jgi:uncharacterized protein (TIGR03437 family)